MLSLVPGGVIKSEMQGYEKATEHRAWNIYLYMDWLKGLGIMDDKKSIGGNCYIFEVALNVTDVGWLFEWIGTLTEMVVSVPEIRTILLGCLPSSMASKGHVNRSLKDVVNNGAVNNRILELGDEFTDLAAAGRALDRMVGSNVGGRNISSKDAADVHKAATDSGKEGYNSGAGWEFSTI